MELISTSPFGQRTLTVGLMKRAHEAQANAQVTQIDKWSLFRDLCTARCNFGISDRDLTVLNALLSFHPPKMLSDNESLIVYPSNRSLSERAHGMTESTLRRHLAALTTAGLIRRQDSPNGKRYAAKTRSGEVVRAFGFDLRPLLVRAEDIVMAAAKAQAEADQIRRLREDVVVMKRDAFKLCLFGKEESATECWDQIEAELNDIQKQMRRKLPITILERLKKLLAPILERIHSLIQTTKMGGTDSQNERHYQNSHKDSSVFEANTEVTTTNRKTEEPKKNEYEEPALPLGLVTKACPDILPYARDGVRNWRDLVNVAEFVRGMMGISQDAWKQAVGAMGAEKAAIAIAGMLQRISEIKNPGGYLRALTNKAADGRFSTGPMIMALLKKS